jgi:hypothetical protein
MSHDLHLWHQPANLAAPATFDDVGRIVLDMAQRPQSADPRFAELALGLVVRHPVAAAGWAADPRHEARALNSALWVLALPEADRPRLLRDVVDLAMPLGLSVADPQIGLAFLPDGTVLPPDQAPLWADLKQQLDQQAPPLTKAEVRKMVVTFVQKVLAPHGFQPIKKERVDAAFIRPLGDGHQLVWLSLAGAAPDLHIRVYAEHWNDEVQRIYNAVFENEWHVPTLGFALSGFVDCQSDELPIGTMAEVREMLRMLEADALPVLNLAAEAGGLLRLLTEPERFPLHLAQPRPGQPSNVVELAWMIVTKQSLKPLIVLWLAHSPAFDDRLTSLRAAFASRTFESNADIDRLLAHLKTLAR